MGGLPCAKRIIDQTAAMTQATSCMAASILLNAGTTQPTDQMADDYQAACNAVAALAAKIERYVRTGSA